MVSLPAPGLGQRMRSGAGIYRTPQVVPAFGAVRPLQPEPARPGLGRSSAAAGTAADPGRPAAAPVSHRACSGPGPALPVPAQLAARHHPPLPCRNQRGCGQDDTGRAPGASRPPATEASTGRWPAHPATRRSPRGPPPEASAPPDSSPMGRCACRKPFQRVDSSEPTLLQALEDEGAVGAAEAEVVLHGHVDLHVARRVGAIVQVALRILVEDVDGRRTLLLGAPPAP